MMTQWLVPTSRFVLLMAVLLLVALLPLSSAPVALAQGEGIDGPWVVGGVYRIALAATDARASAYASSIATAPSFSAAGGGYVLLLPVEVQGTGTPCCCMHLPCIKK